MYAIRSYYACQPIGDDQGDQFFRKLVGTVIVGTVAGRNRQAVGMMPGADQMIACCLTGGIGAVGLIEAGFGKRWFLRLQRAIDLVGADVVETEVVPGGCRKCRPMVASRFEQNKGPVDIGAHEIARTVDATVHMALRRKVDNGTRLVLFEQLVNQFAVADISYNFV